MSDHIELKKAALRVVEIESSEGESISDAWEDFESAANPAAVLTLISEVEGLRAQHGRDSAELRSLCQARDDARKERDQLKAEVERLKNRLEVDPRHDYDGISTRDATVKVLDEQVDQLKAENERLHESDQEATELCDTLSVLLGEIAVAVRGPEEPKSRHGFHDLPSRVKTVVSERDQLEAEVEALRKDAELHQQIQRAAKDLPSGWEIRVCVEHESGYVELWDQDGCEVDFPNSCESLALTVSDAIDGAMSNGEQP